MATSFWKVGCMSSPLWMTLGLKSGLKTRGPGLLRMIERNQKRGWANLYDILIHCTSVVLYSGTQTHIQVYYIIEPDLGADERI